MTLFAAYNPETAEMLGFYDDGFHAKIPDHAVEISPERRAEILAAGGSYVVDPATGTISPAPPPIPTAADLSARLGALRYAAEVGGITLGGMPVPTDRAAASMMATSLATVTTWPIQFKSPAGFVEITESQMQAIVTGVSNHVQLCFHAEASVQALIDDGTITDLDALTAAWDAAI